MVQEAIKHPGWGLLADRAAADVAKKQRQILNGPVVTIEDYRALVGWVQGALFVLNLPDQMQLELDNARSREETQ